MSCAVPECKNTTKFRPEKISFFRFPKNENLLNPWLSILNINKDKWIWTKNKLICSNHFKSEDFRVFSTRTVLNTGAIPLAFIPQVKSEDKLTVRTVELLKSSSSTNTTNIMDSEMRCKLVNLNKEIHNYCSQRKINLLDACKRIRIVNFNKKIHSYCKSPSKLNNNDIKLLAKNVKCLKKLYSGKEKTPAENSNRINVRKYQKQNQHSSLSASTLTKKKGKLQSKNNNFQKELQSKKGRLVPAEKESPP